MGMRGGEGGAAMTYTVPDGGWRRISPTAL